MSESTQTIPAVSEATDDHVPKNFYLGVANGALAQLGTSLMHPTLVLSAFVYERTQSALLSGLLASAGPLGLVWSQLLMSSVIEHRPRKKPFYLFSLVLRVVALAVIVYAIWLSGRMENPLLGVWIFVAAFFAYRSAQGFGNLPFFDIVGQTIHPVHLGPFFAYRSFFGGILVLFSGWFIVQPVLNAFPEPDNYAILVALATCVLAVAWVLFAFVHESENESPPKKRNIRQTLRGGVKMLRKYPNYRLLLIQGILVRVNVMAAAFFVPYGVEEFGARKMAGVFLGVFTFGKLLSSWIWGHLSKHLGNRLCLILVAGFFTLSPVVALISPLVPQTFTLRMDFLPMPISLNFLLYLTAVMIFGFALQGNAVARVSFVLETAPPQRRASYRAFLDTALAPMMLLPLVLGVFLRGPNGHVLPERAKVMFICIIASGLLSIVAALRLQEVRGEQDNAA